MTAFLLFCAIAWVVTAAGRQLAVWLRLPDGASVLERDLIGFALGLGLLAYGVMALGLAGLLYPVAAAAWLLGVALVGARRHGAMVREFRDRARRGVGASKWDRGVLVVMLFFAGVSLVGVYAPPTMGVEWDSVGYHLADPKLYVRAHRLFPIPWEDHSNSSFNTEMCYTLALLFGSVPLAKLFHFACGVGTALAIYAFARRHFSARIGVWASALFVSLPVVFWEAGTAYIDLAVTFHTMLTLLALGRGAAERSERWLGIGAVLMGLTLAAKDTALGTLALLTLGLFVWRLRSPGQGAARSLGLAAAWALTALAVGAPWFVKSWAYTGNPVYPFLYGVFGGRGWSAANATAYQAFFETYGAGRGALDALLLPWNLVMNLLPGHPIAERHQSFNDFQTALASLSPVLPAALFFPVFCAGRAPIVVRALAAFVLGGLLVWFVTAQAVRFLLPLLPMACLLAAWVLGGAWESRSAAGRALAGLAVCSLAFSALVGGQLLWQQAPVAFGLVPRDRYIAAGDPAYPAVQFVNTEIPPHSTIALYGNPLGFYCEKPYFWAEPSHSTIIDYDGLQTPGDLARALRRRGATHVLLNPAYFPPVGHAADLVYGLAALAGPPLYQSEGGPGRSIIVFALPPSP